ncbi:MAG: MBL fold metallo-hydrolase, partial [Gammaproteobacteria bacterium]|nr:MBL fold metallo-hydrolase [Gammaproteobacteria bacterium]
ESNSGDAVCLRYSEDGESWYVGVIDGGTQDSGEALCNHIKKFYKTDVIDFVICTHPDQDHASGLSIVLDKMTVKMVLMHCPWDYIDYFFDVVDDGRVTKESLRKRLIEGLPYAYAIYEKAIDNNIPIFSPFSGNDDHGIPHLKIVGPSGQFYLDQVINFRPITDVTEDSMDAGGLLQGVLGATVKAVKWLAESWDDEMLVDPEDDATSSENNSSVICFFDFDGKKQLFTADAGTPALNNAMDEIVGLGYDLQSFSFVQVPHHGSKRNIGPTVLNQLVGPPLGASPEPTFTAFVSAARKGEPKHPNKRVANAFKRRGGEVIPTQGSGKCLHSDGVPTREGWSKAEPLPFYEEVEDDD